MSSLAADKRIFVDSSTFPRLETLTVSKPSTFMRAAPRPSGSAATEVIFGTRFHVHKTGRGWVWGQLESPLPGRLYPGYVGWVRRSDLSANSEQPSFKITALNAPVFSKSDIKSRVRFHLPLGATITGVSEDDYVRLDSGYIHKAHLALIDAPSTHPDWVAIAETLIGQTYVWGGVSSFGLDCSGLLQTALRVFGKDALRDSDQQAQMGEPVKIREDLSGLKRGDLVFWKGHVGVMISATRLLHANAYHMCVAAEPLAEAVNRIKQNAGPVTAIRRL